MTRNLGTSSSSSEASSSDCSGGGSGSGSGGGSASVGGGAIGRAYVRREGYEPDGPAHSLSLRKLTGGVRRSEAGITSSLLGTATPAAGASENRHARRARVTRSWNGGYGTLLEGVAGGGNSRVEVAPFGGGSAKKASPGNVPQQQFLRSLQRASSTILTKASSAVNNNNSCSHNHNIGASASGSLGCDEPLHPQPQQSTAAGGQQVETADAARRGRIDVLLMPSLKSL